METDMQAALIASCSLLLLVALVGMFCCLCRRTGATVPTAVLSDTISGALTRALL